MQNTGSRHYLHSQLKVYIYLQPKIIVNILKPLSRQPEERLNGQLAAKTLCWNWTQTVAKDSDSVSVHGVYILPGELLRRPHIMLLIWALCPTFWETQKANSGPACWHSWTPWRLPAITWFQKATLQSHQHQPPHTYWLWEIGRGTKALLTLAEESGPGERLIRLIWMRLHSLLFWLQEL